MKYLLPIFLLCCLHAQAQQMIDSFYRDNQMWYTEDKQGLPVRTFYPRSSLQYCRYCGQWRTPAHVKYQKEMNENTDSVWFVTKWVTDTAFIKRKTVK